MKLGVIGSGYVGLISALCLNKIGHEVTVYDVDNTKITNLNNGISPFYEPHLDELLKLALSSQKVSFTSNINHLSDSEIIFICVGTPSDNATGNADLKYLYSAVESLQAVVSESTIIVIKSTVPIGTGKEIHAKYSQMAFASCPEFLREGSAIDDFMNPARIIIGAWNADNANKLASVFKYFQDKTEFLLTDVTTAETIKYAANTFLAMKVAFINEMAKLSDSSGANITDVAKGIGLDPRIGSHFLKPGPGFGGSCFPKDVKALGFTAKKYNLELPIIGSILKSNDMHKQYLADFIIKIAKSNPGKIGILGVTFKANTDDMRDAASLTIVPKLKNAGLEVMLHDPAYMKKKPEEFQQYEFAPISKIINECKVIVILTEWSEFNDISYTKKSILIDFRNIYSISDIKSKEITYYSLGSLNEEVFS